MTSYPAFTLEPQVVTQSSSLRPHVSEKYLPQGQSTIEARCHIFACTCLLCSKLTVLIMDVQEVRAISPVCKALTEQDGMFLLPVFMNKNVMSLLSHKIACHVQPFMLVTAPSLN